MDANFVVQPYLADATLNIENEYGVSLDNEGYNQLYDVSGNDEEHYMPILQDDFADPMQQPVSLDESMFVYPENTSPTPSHLLAHHQSGPVLAPQPMSPPRRVSISTPALRAAAEERRKHDWKYMCLVDGCSGGFTTRTNALRHVRAHFSVKYHKCSCGSDFTSNSDLSRHLETLGHVLNAQRKAEIRQLSREYSAKFSMYVKEIRPTI